MAISYTAADVKPATGNTTSPIVLNTATGVSVTAGQPCTVDADGAVVLAANTSAALSGGTGQPIYIAANAAAAERPVILYPTGSLMDYGGGFGGAGRVVVLGAAGVLELTADQSNSDWLTILGESTAAGILRFIPRAANIQVAGL